MILMPHEKRIAYILATALAHFAPKTDLNEAFRPQPCFRK